MVIVTFLASAWNTLYGLICPKNQNFQFKLKFVTYTNSNMQNSTVKFSFIVSGRKFGPKRFCPKNQNYLFKVKFGICNNSNMPNSMVKFTFSFFRPGELFSGHFVVSKNRNFCFSWNLVFRLIRIYRIQWWCSLFLFWQKITVLGKSCPKI